MYCRSYGIVSWKLNIHQGYNLRERIKEARLMTDYEAYDKIFSKYPDVVSIKDVSKMLGLKCYTERAVDKRPKIW